VRYLIAFFVAAALSIGAAGAGPAPVHADVDTNLYGTGDELVIPGLSIDAPVNTRNVGEDGKMGDPAGKDDVVRYDFPSFPGLGGYPGSGGTAVIGATSTTTPTSRPSSGRCGSPTRAWKSTITAETAFW